MLTRGILMQVNMNPNKDTQSFGAIKLGSGAEILLKKTFKPTDWQKLDKIAQAQETNTVDVHLFNRIGSNQLIETIVPNSSNFKNKDYYQLPFFESAIKFIDKMAKKADNIA